MIPVIYWSQTGNTADMANALAESIRAAGKEAVVKEVADASVDELNDISVFALGCPAMGDEVIEESEMEPFVAELETKAAGKTIGLFGSYGWGDGEWMRSWTQRMQQAGATVLGGENAICLEGPDDDALAALAELGKALAAV